METLSVIEDDQILSLVERCQRGDMSAVEEVYALYAGRLYRYFLSRTADPALASDLVGELFVRIIRGLKSFRLNRDCAAAAFSGWVYRIAANLVTDHRRSQPVRPHAELDDEYRTPSRTPDPHWCAEQHEMLERLARAMGDLTEEQRLVIMGKFGEGLSNAEIAAWLGKTEGSVKSLQHRALHVLAYRMGRKDGRHGREP